MALAAVGDRACADLAKVMGKPELITDKRFDTQIHRVLNRHEVVELVGEWVESCASIMEADQLLTAGNVPSAPVYNIEQLMKDPQLEARRLLVEIDHPAIGKVKVVNSPFHFSKTKSEVRGRSPKLGEHSSDVLQNLLGYNSEQIDKLYMDKVIYSIDRV